MIVLTLYLRILLPEVYISTLTGMDRYFRVKTSYLLSSSDVNQSFPLKEKGPFCSDRTSSLDTLVGMLYLVTPFVRANPSTSSFLRVTEG